ncbi:hypothetical protein D3C79_760550 [compost metagenome]
MSINELYIVRVPFKAGGKYYPPALVLTHEEVQQIKLWKMRVSEQKVVKLDLPKDRLKTLLDVISSRWHVDAVGNVRARVSKGSKVAEPSAKANKPHPGTQTESGD